MIKKCLNLNKTRVISFFVATIIFLSTVVATVDSAVNTNNEETISTQAKWTVMIYFAGDHHRGNELDYTLNFLKEIGSSNNFNLVGLFDAEPYGDTSYYYFEDGFYRPLPWHPSECNLADPMIFERFLTLTINDFPADNFALFTLSAWGSGWQGVFSDTHGTGSGKTLSLITMPQMSEVLKKVTNNGLNKIDFWGTDVCISGMTEVAYQIAPYVDYMAANEEHGFGQGEFSDDGRPMEWNYSFFLQELKNNSDMTPEQFAKSVVECYRAGTITSKILVNIKPPKWYPIVKYHTTLSTIDLKNISEISNAVNTLGSVLKDNLNKCKNEIKKARSETREYGKLYRKFWFQPSRITFGLAMDPLGYDCFIDLYDFAEKLRYKTQTTEIKNACEQVMNAMNTTVIANEAEPTDPSHGLSIYFPELKCQYDQSIWKGMGNKNFRNIPSPYEDLRFSQDTSWDEFLKEYLHIPSIVDEE